MANAVFTRLVEMVQLSPMFAEQVVTRACARANLDAEVLAETQIEALLPHLESSLRIFVPAEGVEQRLKVIRRGFKVS